MMTRNLQLVLVLFATATVCLATTLTYPDVQLDISGIDEDTELSSVRERRQIAETVKCGHRVYMQAKNCCYLPQLIPQTTMQNCSGGRGPPPTNGTIGAAIIKLANGTRDMAREMRMKGGPNHFVEYIFKCQNWVNSNGDLNYATIVTQFLAASNATWQPLVKTAISNCTAQIKASSATSTTTTAAPGVKNFNAKLLVQFMMCITQNLVLNCPAALKVQGKATCSKDVATLATCNPMSLPIPARNARQPA